MFVRDISASDNYPFMAFEITENAAFRSLIESAADSGEATAIGDLLLSRAGFGNARIRDAELLPRGNSVMSQVFRVRIDCTSEDDDVPKTAVLKIPARKANDRTREAATGSYLREIAVYELLKQHQGDFQPVIYAQISDAASRTAAILIEDLGAHPNRSDFTLPAIREVIRNLADHHGRFWGEQEQLSRLWLRSAYRADIFKEDPDLLAPNWRLIADDPELHPCNTPRIDTMADFLNDHIHQILDELDQRTPTLAHGDLHVDNMMLRNITLRPTPVLIDWQDAVLGGATSDVAKFLATTLNASATRQHFSELIDLYYDSLPASVRSGYDCKSFRRHVNLALLATAANYIISATTSYAAGQHPSALNNSLRSVCAVIDAVDPVSQI